MYAKKSLGQHFLRSERAIETIVDAGDLSVMDTVLEIGPGEGVLTHALIDTGAKVIAVEKDDDLFAFLGEKFIDETSTGQLQLVHGDILEFESDEFNKIVANIPYNITGAVIRKFLSADHQPERIMLLVQKEVAERIVAKGDKPFDSAQGKESILSISVKAYGIPRYVEKVLAGSFVPAPRVDSAIICIEDISKDFFTNFGEEEFFTMLRAGFHAKRKKLSSNLSELYPKEMVKNAFHELSLDENTRAEDVKLDIWQQIGQKLLTNSKNS